MRPPEVSIGKFDILATYAYAKALLDGQADDHAKQRGMVAAVMGAKARLGGSTHHEQDLEADRQAAEKKKKATVAAEWFDHQVADKMGDFFDRTFLPAMTELVQAGFSYAEIKRMVAIPATWGAKISGEQFLERWQAARKARGKPESAR